MLAQLNLKIGYRNLGFGSTLLHVHSPFPSKYRITTFQVSAQLTTYQEFVHDPCLCNSFDDPRVPISLEPLPFVCYWTLSLLLDPLSEERVLGV